MGTKGARGCSGSGGGSSGVCIGGFKYVYITLLVNLFYTF